MTIKNKRLLFISIQGSFQNFEISLFDNKNILASIQKKAVRASSILIPEIENLLKKHGLSLEDISFIAIDQGPGAFTSLRVTITLANALAFAQNIPLVGVDGLEALAQETIDSVATKEFEVQPTLLVSLLNAYNKEVYFAIHKITNGLIAIEKNYKNIDLLLRELSEKYVSESILFAGNAVDLYQDKIQETFKNKSIILEKSIDVCSSEKIGEMGLEQWNKKENVQKSLYPLYLKSQKFATRKK